MRSNVVIVKDGFDKAFLYHHFDGYPEGVGCGIQEYMEEIRGLDGKLRDRILQSPESLAEWLSLPERDDTYERDVNCLHGDIEYLYVIDLDAESVTCYSVDAWDFCGNGDDVIDGCAGLDVERKVYECGMYDRFDDIVMES